MRLKPAPPGRPIPTHVPLDSLDYLRILVLCNKAVGECLAMHRDPDDEEQTRLKKYEIVALLTFPIRNAKDFDDAEERLGAGPPWPVKAGDIAAGYEGTFPWLPALFATRKPDEPTPAVAVWEQFKVDLHAHPTYHEWLIRHGRRFVRDKGDLPHIRAFLRGSDTFDPHRLENPLVAALAEIFQGAFRNVVGRAVLAEAVLTTHQNNRYQRIWLDGLLNWSRCEVSRGICLILYGTAKAPKATKRKPPETKSFTDHYGEADYEALLATPRGAEDLAELQARMDRAAEDLPDAMTKLSPDHQRFLQLYREGRATAEIARQMNITKYRAEQLFAEAVTKLQQSLDVALAP